MEDAGFIFASYGLTFGVIGLFAWRVLRTARRLAARVPDEEKYWS